MGGMDFFIRPATGTSSSDWVMLQNVDMTIKMTRRLTRTVIRGGEGDDLHDEGSESTVYTVRGEMSSDTYKQVLAIFRTGQPYIHDPFEERDVKVIFAVMEFDSTNESFRFELIEDVI